MSEIKKAFYRWSRCYHPDRFFHLKGDAAQEAINALYKRITEAYYFLRDDAKRKKYSADIKGPDRVNKLRYTEASETEAKAEKKKEQEEQFGNTPKGREFFKLALAEMDKGNWSGAERNLKSALMYESGNAKFKEKLEEVKQKSFEAARAAGNTGFKIK
jgi:DnaJ-class molecular chaperone